MNVVKFTFTFFFESHLGFRKTTHNFCVFFRKVKIELKKS
jgi:hypothetical protein